LPQQIAQVVMMPIPYEETDAAGKGVFKVIVLSLQLVRFCFWLSLPKQNVSLKSA